MPQASIPRPRPRATSCFPIRWRRQAGCSISGSSAELTEIELGSLTIRMDYAEFDDYWDPLLTGQGPVGSYVQGLNPDLRERVKAQVKTAYLSGAPDGPRSLTATAWAVRGIVT